MNVLSVLFGLEQMTQHKGHAYTLFQFSC